MIPVGLIPAAGLATRLTPLVYPKELLPIVYRSEGGRLLPRPVLQASLDQMRRAAVRQCIIVVSEWKLEIARVFGDGSALGVALAYVIRSQPLGLADALDAARPWVEDRDVCLTLPDTLTTPGDALARIRAERESSAADVVLGVFPCDFPEELGPVRVDSHGHVVEVFDKPKTTDLRNTWGMAIWSPRFTALLSEQVAVATGDVKPVLGAVFQRAIDIGLRVRAVTFSEGSFIDVGTTHGIAAALGSGAMFTSTAP